MTVRSPGPGGQRDGKTGSTTSRHCHVSPRVLTGQYATIAKALSYVSPLAEEAPDSTASAKTTGDR